MSPISTKRHSLAHIMAQAIKSLYGNEVAMATGPDTDTGFFYDFDFGERVISDADLRDIEKKMKNIVKQNQKFVRSSMSAAEAKVFLGARGEIYKLQIIDDLVAQGETEIGFYTNVDQTGKEIFVDMCAGPHVEKTAEIDENSFRLERVSGAYWRGDEKNKMLTRVSALAFDTREELEWYVKMIEEAKKRDHRIIGKKLKLFTTSELVGAGLPLLQPKWALIKRALEDYLWELHREKGYDRVWTPHLAKEDLYRTSGHLAHYKDDMFMVQGASSKETFCVKPMNCPHHMQIFADNQWSYRDMPVRYFEPATIYRDEKSGQLGGLTRVRAITQDDGHLFCRPSQIHQEFSTIVDIIKEFYGVMGMIDGYWVRLSLRGEDTTNYLWSDEVWNTAESALKAVCDDKKLPYRPAMGEAAFYGPKLDFMFKDAIGREWQLATIQCDFNLPERFDLSYTNEKGESERPVVIHRAISGSLERFMGVMIEHFAGTFPLWLAPVQCRILVVAEAFSDYAFEVSRALRSAGIRVEVDTSGESLGKKIRNGEGDHINYLLVIGEKEVTDRSVSARNYKTKEQTPYSLQDFIDLATTEIKNKAL